MTTPTPVSRGRSTSTDPTSEDPSLQGRTYTIPFDPVWEAALALAGGGLRGWRVLEADDQSGSIEAEASWLVFPRVADVQVQVKLDANAQTRVDLSMRSRARGPTLGAHRRRIRAFFTALDGRLAARPEQILHGSPEVSPR